MLKSAVALRNAGRTLSRRHRSGKSTNALASLAGKGCDRPPARPRPVLFTSRTCLLLRM